MKNLKSSCMEFEALLDAYHDGELEPAERQLVDAHLQSCAACQAKIDSIQNVVSSLKGLPKLELRKDFAADIEGLLASRSAKQDSNVIRPAAWGSLGLAAAAVALFVFFQNPWANLSHQASGDKSASVASVAVAPASKPQPLEIADSDINLGQPDAAVSGPNGKTPQLAPLQTKAVMPSPLSEEAQSGNRANRTPADDHNSQDVQAQSTKSDNMIEVAAMSDSEQGNSITESIGLGSDEDGVYALEM